MLKTIVIPGMRLVLMAALLLDFRGTMARAEEVPGKDSAGKSGVGKTVWLVDLQKAPLQEMFAAYAVQGLVNRSGPRVFLKPGEKCHWMSFDYDGKNKKGMPIWDAQAAGESRRKYATIEDYWIKYFHEKEHYDFQPVALAQLLAQSKGVVKGWILYDNIKEDCSAAATLAGLEDAIPVTAALKAQFEKEGVALPVVFDFRTVRSKYPSGVNKRLEAHRWVIENLLPRVNKDGAVSRARLYNSDPHDTIVDMDQAVQNRWVLYDLDHTAASNNLDASKKSPDPEDKKLLDQILGSLNPFSMVYGWAVSGEDSFIRSLNRNRLLGECSGVVNNSFFAKVPCALREFKQKRAHVTPENVRVEDKIYVAFMVNECDSIKAANSLMCFGSWLQPERGKIPINWGIQPNLLWSHPGMMAYYYDTMTENDYFFAPPSGWGYTHPSYLPADALMPYAAKVKAGMERADLRYIDIWWVRGLETSKRLQPFLKATGASGLTDWDNSRQAVVYTDGGVPVIKSNYYYTYNGTADEFAKRLLEDMRDVPRPWFVVVYGAQSHGTPYVFNELGKRLPAEKFKPVMLDEFFSAAVKARKQVEGRVWKPGPNAPKGVAP